VGGAEAAGGEDVAGVVGAGVVGAAVVVGAGPVLGAVAAGGFAEAAGAPLAAGVAVEAGAALAVGALPAGAFAGWANAGITPARAVVAANQKASTERFIFPRLAGRKRLTVLFTRSPRAVIYHQRLGAELYAFGGSGEGPSYIFRGPRPPEVALLVRAGHRPANGQGERGGLTGWLVPSVHSACFQAVLPARNRRRNSELGTAAQIESPAGTSIDTRGPPRTAAPSEASPVGARLVFHGRRPG
jgi:hypothetical protein